jgi:hypothetical protein
MLGIQGEGQIFAADFSLRCSTNCESFAFGKFPEITERYHISAPPILKIRRGASSNIFLFFLLW